MTSYQPPLDEIRFALTHHADLEGLARLPGFEAASPDLVDQVLAEAGRFAASELAPLNAPGDRQRARLTADGVRTPDGYKEAYREVRRGRLARPAVPRGLGRPGPALDRRDRGLGDVEQRQPRVLPLPDPHAGGRRAAAALRHRRPARALPAQARERRVDRHDVPDRAAGRLRRRRAQDARGARGRSLPDHRDQDLHHLRRARPHRQHDPHGARADPRRAARHARHLAVPDPEVPGRGRRLARCQERPALRLARAQARHPREPDLRDGVRRGAGRHRLAGRRGAGRHGGDVHDDEQRPPVGRARGARARRALLPGGACLRPRAGPGAAPERRRGAAGGDHRASRRAPHAGHDEDPDRGDAGAGLFGGRGTRSRRSASPTRRAARRPKAGFTS